MKQTIPFDPFLCDFFEFINDKKNKIDNRMLFCLMERISGKKLHEIAKECPRQFIKGKGFLMPYKQLEEDQRDKNDWSMYPKMKYSKQEQKGVTKEIVRQKLYKTFFKFYRFMNKKYKDDWYNPEKFK